MNDDADLKLRYIAESSITILNIDWTNKTRTIMSTFSNETHGLFACRRLGRGVGVAF